MTESGCWLWEWVYDSDGYGVLRVEGRKLKKAHRLSYEAFYGPIPQGLLVMHTCDITSCANPDHLRTGTHKDNHGQRELRGRHPHRNLTHGERDMRRPQRWSVQRNVKLTPEAIADIRAGGSPKDLAAKYGVHQSQISRIQHNKRWKEG